MVSTVVHGARLYGIARPSRSLIIHHSVICKRRHVKCDEVWVELHSQSARTSSGDPAGQSHLSRPPDETRRLIETPIPVLGSTPVWSLCKGPATVYLRTPKHGRCCHHVHHCHHHFSPSDTPHLHIAARLKIIQRGGRATSCLGGATWASASFDRCLPPEAADARREVTTRRSRENRET
jgi:hypothetical protein